MFKAIVLDLFDTLVNWDPDGLPLMQWKGRETHSTLPWILPKVAEALGAKYDLDAFMSAYAAVYEEINHERERDGVEITCFERFERTLKRVGVSDGASLERLAEELLASTCAECEMSPRRRRRARTRCAASRKAIASGYCRISTTRRPDGKSWPTRGQG